jgi:hypothetical protein
VAAGRVGPSRISLSAPLSGARLVRGDNLLRLVAPEGGVRLLAYRLAVPP